MEMRKKTGCSKFQKLPVKVTDEKRSRKVGLVVSSLIDLKKKSHDLLKVSADSYNLDSLYVALEDGTEISDDEYLFSLANNTLLIIFQGKPAAQTYPGKPLCGVTPSCQIALEFLILCSVSLQQTMERYLSAFYDLQNFNSEEVVKFFEDNKDEKLKVTWQYVTTLSSSKSHLSSISDHPEWFTGWSLWS